MANGKNEYCLGQQEEKKTALSKCKIILQIRDLK